MSAVAADRPDHRVGLAVRILNTRTDRLRCMIRHGAVDGIGDMIALRAVQDMLNSRRARRRYGHPKIWG